MFPGAPYLVDGIPALGVVTEEVACEEDARDVGRAALRSLVPKLSCPHVYQQLGAQEAVPAAASQAQSGHQ